DELRDLLFREPSGGQRLDEGFALALHPNQTILLEKQIEFGRSKGLKMFLEGRNKGADSLQRPAVAAVWASTALLNSVQDGCLPLMRFDCSTAPPNLLAAPWHHFFWSEGLILGRMPFQGEFGMYRSQGSGWRGDFPGAHRASRAIGPTSNCGDPLMRWIGLAAPPNLPIT